MLLQAFIPAKLLSLSGEQIMPAKGTSMLKLTQILRLHFDAKLSTRQIAKSLSLSVGVVSKYINRATDKSLSWPLSEDIDEKKLESLLKPHPNKRCGNDDSGINFAKTHQELKLKGITLQLLWDEYTSGIKSPLSYSRYCHLYRIYKQSLKRSMRQAHKAGDKVFIDYSGKTVDIIDPETGAIRKTEIFVGVLGASSYTFAEATWTQQLPDFLASQQRMFEFFGGVPALVVPDNLKSAINKTCRYEPEVNQTYSQFIEHYSTAVLPTRPYKPKDKAKAEAGVQLVQRWVIARLRHQTFVGLAELNNAIKKLLTELNQKPFQKLEGCRESNFIAIDKPALKDLPAIAYRYRQYKKARAGIDYHIELEGHYYSIPHRFSGKSIDLWFNQYTVECYVSGKQVATHLYSSVKGAHTTIGHHMPTNHQKQSEYSKERFIRWAGDIGAYTQAVSNKILESKPHPEQGYRSCLGLLVLAKKYGKSRLENACCYGFSKSLNTRKNIISILENGLDQCTFAQDTAQDTSYIAVPHDNIRGPHYYN